MNLLEVSAALGHPCHLKSNTVVAMPLPSALPNDHHRRPKLVCPAKFEPSSTCPVKYLLDDGTGLLACTQYERSNRRGAIRQGHAERHELGDFLIVQGKLKRYRG